MGWIEIVSCILILILGVLTTISDFKEGIIRNRLLLWFFIVSVIFDVINYGLINRNLLGIFFFNFGFVSIISLVLFFTHSFAGGDCKLMIVYATLYPSTCCLSYEGLHGTLILSLGIAFIYGFFYLVIASIVLLIKKKNRITWRYAGNYLLDFLSSYISATVYLNIISIVMMWINTKYVIFNELIITIACIAFAFFIGKKPQLKKSIFIIPAIIVDLALCLLFGIYPISLNTRNYVLLLILLLCQMMIRTNLYDEVNISEMKKGVILSTMTSMMMQNSRINGLPGISDEGLNARLNEEEVEAVKRWAKSRNIKSVCVVKKIPFAFFIFMGIITYFVMWGVIYNA